MHQPDQYAGTNPRVAQVAAAFVIVLLTAIYLPALGKGLIKDDFRWILAGELTGPADLARVFSSNVGVYRPVVALSFGVNYALFGLAPLGYGLTNFLLLGACVILIARLGAVLGLSPGFCYLAAGLWALNFHGIGGALLWPSGRIALLLCLFGLLTMLAWLNDRSGPAAFWLLLALFSKEEAVVLPGLLCVAAVVMEKPVRWRLHLGLSVLAVCAYLSLRYYSGAFWPSSAPAYYRPSASFPVLVRNAAEYADRSCTFTVAALGVLLAVARVIPQPAQSRRLWGLGLGWFVIAFAPTVAIPARSSLYVLWPSVGLTLVAAAFAEDVFSAIEPRRRRAVVVAALIAPWLLYPVYHLRNQRMKNVGALSGAAIEQLRVLNSSIPSGARVVLLDDRSTNASLSNAFGTLLGEVRTLAIPRAGTLELDPPPEGAEATPPALKRPELVTGFRVEKGKIVGVTQ